MISNRLTSGGPGPVPRFFFRHRAWRNGAGRLGKLSWIWLALLPSGIQANELRLGTMAVHEAQAEKTVRHGVEIRSPLEAGRRGIMLEGPRRHSVSSTSASDGSAVEARFNWYAIAATREVPPRRVSVSMAGMGGQSSEFQVGSAVYFLSTAQVLAEGKPPRAPDGFSHFVAYRIVGGSGAAKKAGVEVPAGPGKKATRHGRPVLLCVPTEEWHHGEYSPVADPAFCLVVYETGAFGKRGGTEAAALDQFGLNSLRLKRAELAAVPGRQLTFR